MKINPTEANFENWKRNLDITTSAELYEAVGKMCIANDFPLCENDPLGIVTNDGEKYFCLGDPCSPLVEQLAAPCTEFELTEDEDEADDNFLADSERYYIIY